MSFGGCRSALALDPEFESSGVRVSLSRWHLRLGQSASPIMQHVLHRHQLPVESKHKDLSVCDVYQQGKSHELPF
jgi:hypothetical protein